MVGVLAAGGSLAGWIIVFGVCTGGPRLGRAGRGEGVLHDGTEPPAVVGLLAGAVVRDLFTATLLDLAARGWFTLTPPARADGPAMCTLPAEAPIEPLTPYEQRAVSHLGRRAGTLDEVPAEALADAFDGGEAPFLKAFRPDVIADARARGLTRPTLSTARKLLLCLLAVVPVGIALIAALAGRHRGLAESCIVYFLILCSAAGAVTSERLTSVGQHELAAWRARATMFTGARDTAYAAAAGLAPAALAQFSPRGKDVAWSSYGEGWRLVTIGDVTERTWPGLTGGACSAVFLLAMPGLPILGVLGAVFAGGLRGAELGVALGLALDAAVLARGVAPWLRLPTFAEFDGMILRQWETAGSEDESATYYVAIDDGVRPQAWAFQVASGVFGQLTPGTLAHVRVNPRLNKLLGIQPVRPAASSPRLADPGDPGDPRRPPPA
jgi:hypothetical protein